MSTVQFDPSLLGTKEHWDERYSTDLANFRESGLEGEVWFGEEPVEKMVAWTKTHVPPTAFPSVLDVGTGNGHLLFALVDAGYDASHLTGIDYCQSSIDLSIAIARQRNPLEENTEAYTHMHPHPRAYEHITFSVCDFLDPTSLVPTSAQARTSDGLWDLILDKGTYDAISLMDRDERGVTPLERYVPRVVTLLGPNGCFLITSCNFTEHELIQQVAPHGSALEYKGSVPYKKFTFGGSSGSSYVTVAFQKSSSLV